MVQGAGKCDANKCKIGFGLTLAYECEREFITSYCCVLVLDQSRKGRVLNRKKTIIYSLLTSARKANVENWKMWHQNANVENAGLENAKKENMGHRKLLKVSHV